MKIRTYLLLHLLLLLYAASSVISKFAAEVPFLSIRFLLLYAAVLVLLAVYALGWQQVIKRLPLTAAYANKAVTVVWGILAGIFFFSEALTPGKIIGAVLVIAGVVLFAFSEKETDYVPRSRAQRDERGLHNRHSNERTVSQRPKTEFREEGNES